MNSPITNEVVFAYLETLVWSETLLLPEGTEVLVWEGSEYREGESLDNILDHRNLPDAINVSAAEDLEGFRESCIADLGLDPFVWFDAKQVAHDFCLSRNGHGAGFFDDSYEVRAEGPGAGPKTENLSKRLQDCAKYEGTHGLTVWVENDELKVEEHS